MKNKKFSSFLENFVEKIFVSFLKSKNTLNINYNIELLQFLELYKIKKYKNESMERLHSIFIELPFYISTQKLLSLLEIFIPDIYSSFDEYVTILFNNPKLSGFSARNLQIFLYLEKTGKVLDKASLLEIVRKFIFQNNKGGLLINKYRRLFLQIIEDPFIIDQIKSSYDENIKNKIIESAKTMLLAELDEYNFKNFKNLVSLDPSLIDELLEIYLKKLYSRHTTHKMANIDRIFKMIHFIPEISSKKILSWLSSHNKSEDIKYLMIKYPECKKFAAFV
jgi:hypothetical protein